MIERGAKTLPTVLIIDDEHDVVESLADVLRREFHVLGTTDPEEALKALESQDVTVVVTDQRMPGLTGTQLLARASNLSPDTVQILLTGYSDIQAVVQAINETRVFYYLSKPWSNVRILDLIRTAVRTYALATEERKLLKEFARLGREAAITALRTDLVRDHEETYSRRVTELKAALALARLAFAHLSHIEEKIPICFSCERVRTPDATWSNLLGYLRENSFAFSSVLCSDCASRAVPEPLKGAAREEDTENV